MVNSNKIGTKAGIFKPTESSVSPNILRPIFNHHIIGHPNGKAKPVIP